MKRLLFFFVMFFMGLAMAFAQAPANEQLTYQSVVRNAQNQIVYNQGNVTVTVTVWTLDGSSVRYREQHTGLSTNANGLLTLMVGGGTPIDGAWSDINWSDASIQTEISYNPGAGTVTITSERAPVTAIPYALQAGNVVPQVNADWNATNGAAQILNKPTIPTVPTNVSAFTNDAGYLTEHQDISGKANTADLATVATTGNYSDLNGTPAINNATLTIKQGETTLGTFTANASEAATITVPTPAAQVNADWNATSGAAQILNKPTIPTVPTNVSAFTNDAGYLTEHQDISGKANTADLATVATTGNYNDLSNKPTIPTVNNATLTIQKNGESVGTFTANQSSNKTINIEVPAAQVNANWNATSGVAQILNKPTLATVATTGNYNDLSNKPTIPTVNNATLTVAITGGTTTTFTANSSTNANVSLAKVAGTGSYNDLSNKPTIPTVPSNVAAFTNDAGYITQANFEQYVATLSQAYQNKIDSLGNIVSATGLADATPPIVITDIVSNIGQNTATIQGEVFADGGSPVTNRGFCWGVTPNPTVTANSHVQVGTGTGSFSGTISGLAAWTTYYVRAYAYNHKGIAYGENKVFNTLLSNDVLAQACPGTPTVTDIDGNVYPTVYIGTHCWMRENLRTTRYADGTDIPLNTVTSSTSPNRYYPNNDASLVKKYGYLYNWPCATRGETGNANPSGIKGVCPDNWHVPSQAEWEQLETYVGSYYTNVAVALADKTGWTTSTGNNTPGKAPSNNNASGFSALPAGMGHHTTPTKYFSDRSCFWSTASNKSYYMTNSTVDLRTASTETFSLAWGMSVRCVKD